jgi:hypothetical protein
MTRHRTTVDEVLASIRRNGGSRDASVARSLFREARKAGAELRPQQNSVSVRVPGPPHKKPNWLTLFVVSEGGTFYTNWTDRWSSIAAPPSVSRSYLDALRRALGRDTYAHPTAYKQAVPLALIRVHLRRVAAAVAVAAQAIRLAVKRGSGHAMDRGLPRLADYEGAITEFLGIRRKRSAPLRISALRASRGVCAACGQDFSAVLAGRGWRVLQVHHRKQLSSTDHPRLTSADDLAVLCSNCHLLVHFDPKDALAVEDLHAMLHGDS